MVGVVFLIIIYNLLMGGAYTIVEKFRVNLVGKVNVERSGIFLMLVKVKMVEVCGCIV